MKSLNIIFLCAVLIMVSCSKGEDGATGPTGPAGANGINGTDGVDGIDGANGTDGISCWDLNGNGIGDPEEDMNTDGNYDALDCQGAEGLQGEQGPQGLQGPKGADGNANVGYADYDISNFSGNQLTINTGYTILELNTRAFLFYLKRFNLWYSVPGPLGLNTTYTRVFHTESQNGSDLVINFYRTSDDTDFNVAVNTYSFLRVVEIEFGFNINKGSHEDIIQQLKDKGVDINDYNAVAKYFGLE
ncbi:collagen-like protein [Flagellimonas meishanensis]|uniref:collagen-like protein n=1 Tax=Flagellimonas meishanensis TaxID=2873264 RepID=UPI001CA5F778|nr:collagen-like protein [[Muricauda] meishanensis]